MPRSRSKITYANTRKFLCFTMCVQVLKLNNSKVGVKKVKRGRSIKSQVSFLPRVRHIM